MKHLPITIIIVSLSLIAAGSYAMTNKIVAQVGNSNWQGYEQNVEVTGEKSETTLYQEYLRLEGDPKIAKLQELGVFAIDRRLTDLSSMAQRINNQNGQIDPHMLDQLRNRINDASTNLNGLKILIQSTAGLHALQQHIQKIYYDYRIYRVSIPQIKGQISVSAVAHFYDAIWLPLQNEKVSLLTSLQESGKDTTHLEELFNQLETKLNQAKSLSQDAQSNLENMKTGSDVSSTDQLRESANSKLSQVKSILESSRDIVRQIIDQIHVFQT